LLLEKQTEHSHIVLRFFAKCQIMTTIVFIFQQNSKKEQEFFPLALFNVS
jgi:hypothetical protein